MSLARIVAEPQPAALAIGASMIAIGAIFVFVFRRAARLPSPTVQTAAEDEESEVGGWGARASRSSRAERARAHEGPMEERQHDPWKDDWELPTPKRYAKDEQRQLRKWAEATAVVGGRTVVQEEEEMD